MKGIGIFYGSSTGTTAAIAEKIAKMLNISHEDVHNVAKTAPSAVGEYKTLILGSSTWGNGELEEDWFDFLTGIESLDLRGKKIALFGCGDETMSETFCNAVGIIYDRLVDTGAEFIAPYDTVGYEFKHTAAEKDGVVVGLLLDEVNHPEATALRLRGWIAEVEKVIG